MVSNIPALIRLPSRNRAASPIGVLARDVSVLDVEERR